eukprot:scaffold6578_cov141-Skeletonema_marinoi.AAC.24
MKAEHYIAVGLPLNSKSAQECHGVGSRGVESVFTMGFFISLNKMRQRLCLHLCHYIYWAVKRHNCVKVPDVDKASVRFCQICLTSPFEIAKDSLWFGKRRIRRGLI